MAQPNCRGEIVTGTKASELEVFDSTGARTFHVATDGTMTVSGKQRTRLMSGFAASLNAAGADSPASTAVGAAAILSGHVRISAAASADQYILPTVAVLSTAFGRTLGDGDIIDFTLSNEGAATGTVLNSASITALTGASFTIAATTTKNIRIVFSSTTAAKVLVA